MTAPRILSYNWGVACGGSISRAYSEGVYLFRDDVCTRNRVFKHPHEKESGKKRRKR